MSFFATSTQTQRATDRPMILFARALLCHWLELMSCAAFTFLGLWATYANWGRAWVLWASFLLGGYFLLVAAYRVWLKEHEDWAANTQRSDTLITDLQEAVARKHPFDEDTVAVVRTEITKLEGPEVHFLGWLLKMDRPGQSQIQGGGFHQLPESILQKSGTLLIGFDPVRSANGLVEMDRRYYINPRSEQAIKDVLFPPQRIPQSSAR